MKVIVYDTEYILCDARIDQGRYIGEDPIGYGCSNQAKYEIGGLHLCEECKTMLKDEPERITLPTIAIEWKEIE